MTDRPPAAPRPPSTPPGPRPLVASGIASGVASSAPPPSTSFSSSSGAHIVRAAREADLERLLEIHASAFPDARRNDARRRNFEHNALGGLDRLRVLEEDGQLVAHAFLFQLEAWFGGRAVAAGGIASVGVAPEARGRRVASRLLAALHDEALARGAAITILFAFRQAFYARHGYAPTTPSRRLAFSPASVPRAWVMLRPELAIRAANGGDRDAIEGVYRRAAARATGWITRPPRLWNATLLDERRRWFIVTRGASVVGFASWTVSQTEAHAASTLVVHDLVADDDESRRALWGLVGAQRDQVTEVLAHVDALDPIDRGLVDADRARAGTAELEHPLGTIAGGPMVRMVDPARALVARGYACDGTLELDVDGQRIHLEVRAGEAHLGPSRATSALTVGAAGLAAIAYGALSASDAARLGWLSAPDAGTLRAADALFALPPYHAIDAF